MLEVSGIRISLDDELEAQRHGYKRVVAKALKVSAGAVHEAKLLKRSVDARRKTDVHFLASFAVDIDGACEAQVIAAAEAGKLGTNVHVKQHSAYEFPAIPCVDVGQAALPRCVVVGSGPAGLFAAWYLAQAGLRPLMIERGECIDDRLATVDIFNRGGALNTESNIQFGEGGAGTFSDGKLTTNTKNPRVRDVLHIFAQAGAPEEILWQAKPHIGTDKLIHVVRTLRNQIIELGGSVRFNTRLDDIHICAGGEGTAALSEGVKAQVIRGITVCDTRTNERETIACDMVVLAIGHSARDTFNMLHESAVYMEPKPFSVGVRIEHKQARINEAQYGKSAHHPALGAADYKLSAHVKSGRGVYTFCMCPGGEVVCATSEEGGVVVNGMSQHARDGVNANSAVLVGIDPEDYGGSLEKPLAGVDFQRKLEHAAYAEAQRCGGKPYQAPAQRVGEFMTGVPVMPTKHAPKPTYARGTVHADLHRVLPPFVCEAMVQALPAFDRRIHGFADPDAIMTGVETRSSSPVRIVRDESYQANVSGLYPCGEGAGYAGGIMSAAVDGLRIAQSIVQGIIE